VLVNRCILIPLMKPPQRDGTYRARRAVNQRGAGLTAIASIRRRPIPWLISTGHYRDVVGVRCIGPSDHFGVRPLARRALYLQRRNDCQDGSYESIMLVVKWGQLGQGRGDDCESGEYRRGRVNGILRRRMGKHLHRYAHLSRQVIKLQPLPPPGNEPLSVVLR